MRNRRYRTLASVEAERKTDAPARHVTGGRSAARRRAVAAGGTGPPAHAAGTAAAAVGRTGGTADPHQAGRLHGPG
ncbi:MAG: hypothetical protein D6725_17805, partial [Planctomycetota bacterium]